MLLPFPFTTPIMFVKPTFGRNSLIVGAILLAVMPLCANPITVPQFDSTDETPATGNFVVRRAAPRRRQRL